MKGFRKTSVEELVEAYTEELLAWACFKVSDMEHAKDLVQDTFLAASEKYDEFKGNSTHKTWLFSILNHKIIDFYRKKVRQPWHSIDENGGRSFFDEDGEWVSDQKPKDWHNEDINLLDDGDFVNVLNGCIESLPPKWNACVTLKYMAGKRGEEICQELGIAPTNFWQIIHRAKLHIRSCIESKWFNT